jgi:hypothetical protein
VRAKDRYQLCTRQLITETLVGDHMMQHSVVGEFLLTDTAAVQLRQLGVHTVFILCSLDGDVDGGEAPGLADVVPVGCVASPDLAPKPDHVFTTNGACGFEFMQQLVQLHLLIRDREIKRGELSAVRIRRLHP